MTVELEIDPDGFKVSFVVLASTVEGVTPLRITKASGPAGYGISTFGVVKTSVVNSPWVR